MNETFREGMSFGEALKVSRKPFEGVQKVPGLPEGLGDVDALMSSAAVGVTAEMFGRRDNETLPLDERGVKKMLKDLAYRRGLGVGRLGEDGMDGDKYNMLAAKTFVVLGLARAHGVPRSADKEYQRGLRKGRVESEFVLRPRVRRGELKRVLNEALPGDTGKNADLRQQVGTMLMRTDETTTLQMLTRRLGEAYVVLGQDEGNVKLLKEVVKGVLATKKPRKKIPYSKEHGLGSKIQMLKRWEKEREEYAEKPFARSGEQMSRAAAEVKVVRALEESGVYGKGKKTVANMKNKGVVAGVGRMMDQVRGTRQEPSLVTATGVYFKLVGRVSARINQGRLDDAEALLKVVDKLYPGKLGKEMLKRTKSEYLKIGKLQGRWVEKVLNKARVTADIAREVRVGGSKDVLVRVRKLRRKQTKVFMSKDEKGEGVDVEAGQMYMVSGRGWRNKKAKWAMVRVGKNSRVYVPKRWLKVVD